MPDPSLSEAMAEAAALAPADELIKFTMEVRHEDFVDDNGDADSLWLVSDTEALTAPLESNAPVRGGQWVTFQPVGFSFSLPPIEPGATAEIEITLDGVNLSLMQYLDVAVSSAKPVFITFRPYLDSIIADGPQMDPVPTFEATEITLGVSTISLRARTGVDLRGAFPVRQYTLTEFPGLAGR